MKWVTWLVENSDAIQLGAFKLALLILFLAALIQFVGRHIGLAP